MKESVPSVADATAIEADYLVRGEPALPGAREAFVRRWESGCRDRETALRLAFLDWYSCSEPDFLTGMAEVSLEESLFDECSSYLLTAHPNDEVCFVLGWMMTQFPYCCGSEPLADCVAQGKMLWSKSSTPGRRPRASVFSGRGAYGNYFAQITTSAR